MKKKTNFLFLGPNMPVNFDLLTEKGQWWKGCAVESQSLLMDLLLVKLFSTATCSPQRY